jgi:hypothetical protein
LWNQSLNSDGQQLDQYQQSAQWSLTLTHWTQKDHDIWRPGLGHYLGVVPTAAIYGVPSFKSVEMVGNENHLPRCDIYGCLLPV